MTIGIRQVQIGASASGTSVSCTVTPTLAGSTIVAFLCHIAAFMNQVTPTGPTGFTLISEVFEANYSQVDAYYKDNESSGVTTYTASGGNNVEKALIVFELTSPLTSGSLDLHNETHGTSTAPSCSLTTLSQASEAVLGVITAVQNAAITADGSATATIESHNVNGAFLGQGKVVASTTGPTLAGGTTSVKWQDYVASFKDSGGGGGGGGSPGSRIATVPSIPSIR